MPQELAFHIVDQRDSLFCAEPLKAVKTLLDNVPVVPTFDGMETSIVLHVQHTVVASTLARMVRVYESDWSDVLSDLRHRWHSHTSPAHVGITCQPFGHVLHMYTFLQRKPLHLKTFSGPVGSVEHGFCFVIRHPVADRESGCIFCSLCFEFGTAEAEQDRCHAFRVAGSF